MQDAAIGARSKNSNETIAPDNGRPHAGLPVLSILPTDDANYPLPGGDGDEDEDEDEEDSEEEEQLPPAPGGVSSPGTKRKTKERIQRTGKVDLNLTDNYGKKSNWGVREGIRELIQNFADNVHTKPDGTPREVEWVFEGEKDRVPTYIAYEKGKKPILGPRSILHDRKKALGYMFHRLDEGLFVLVNHNTKLSRNVWSMGETSKENAKHCIGGHGDGMKVGICALLRCGLQVCYYTNREIWEWHFSRRYWSGENKVLNKLLIQLHPHKPRLAKRDPHLHQDVREARMLAGKSTTVVVRSKYKMNIDFGDFLFLQPPTGEIRNTELGTVILDDKYRHKIFVKGIFIESRDPGNPPPVRYGIDFSQASLDRDRRNFMTHSEAANSIARIWDIIISRAPDDTTTQKYLELLLKEVDYLDVLSAETCISLPSAQALFRQLLSLYPGAFFYSKENKEISETIRIIRTCLAKEPIPISNRLHKILLKYNLIKTAQAMREEIFVNSPPAEIQLDIWTKHTMHALKSALLLHPILSMCQYGFYDVPETVGLNILRVKDQGLKFKLHHRLLNFKVVHTRREVCRLFQNRRDGIVDEDAVCDCAVDDLLELLLSEIDEMAYNDKNHIKHLHKNLLNNMPRHVIVQQQGDLTDLRVEISWEVLESERFRTDFEVFLLSETSWDMVRESHRYYKALNVEIPEDFQNPLSSDSSSSQTQAPNGPRIPSSMSQSIPEIPHAEYVWNGKTSGSTPIIHLDQSIPPGNHYIAVIRSIAQNGAFYSLPFAVDIPCLPPQHVFVKREDPTISVKWTYFSFPAYFKIVCTSIYETLHTSEMISGTSYDFKVDGSEELDLEIHMFAVANGVQSHDIVLQVEAKGNVLEEMDEESCWGSCSPGTVPASTLDEGISNDRLGSPLSEGSGTHSLDVEGESVNDGFEDYMPYIEEDNVDGSEVESPVRLGANEDEVVLRENSVVSGQESQGRSLTDSPIHRPVTPLLAIPSPQDEEALDSRVELSTSDRTPSHSENMEPSSPNPLLPFPLNQGSTCRVKLTDGSERIIHIHHNNQETKILTVTNFLSGGSLYGNLQAPATEGEEGLFVVYKNWMLAGEEADADQLASCQVVEVLGDNIRIRKPDDASYTSSSANMITYSVEWGIKVEDQLHEIRSLHNSKENISIYPTDHEILKRGNIAYHIGSGIPGWSVGFEKVGFTISVAAGLDEISLQTWKSNQEGTLYSEDLAEFLKEFPKRLQKQELQIPTVLLISTSGIGSGPSHAMLTEDDSKLLDHGIDCNYLASVSDAITTISPPMIVLSTSPKLLNPAHMKCLSKLYNTLLSNCYEFRFTIYDSSDYGTVQSTRKAILFASRIGLRNPPDGVPFDTNVEQHLVAQGFARDYRVHGDSLIAKIRMIKETVPPPMSWAFGRFVRDHVKELVSLTETVEQVCDLRKRKPEEENVGRENKRVR